MGIPNAFPAASSKSNNTTFAPSESQNRPINKNATLIRNVTQISLLKDRCLLDVEGNDKTVQPHQSLLKRQCQSHDAITRHKKKTLARPLPSFPYLGFAYSQQTSNEPFTPPSPVNSLPPSPLRSTAITASNQEYDKQFNEQSLKDKLTSEVRKTGVQIPDCFATLPNHTQELLCLIAISATLDIRESLITFSLNYALVENKKRGVEMMSHEKTLSLLGKILYFSDRNPILLKQWLAYNTQEKIIDAIEKHFEKVLLETSDRLSKLNETLTKTGIHNPKIGLYTKIPVELAHLLITNTGFFNLGLVRSILNCFIMNRFHPHNYERSICNALSLLKKNEEMRFILSNVIKPVSSESMANHLIRIQLNKKNHEPVADVDAIKTALIALMSHVRQGPSGTCFATHLKIVLLSSHLKQCLIDFRQLLAESKLSRTIQNVRQDFPFLLRMRGLALEKKIVVSIRGVLNTGAPIDEVPGLRAACRILGLKHHKKELKAAIVELIKKQGKSDSSITVTAQQLLKQLAHNTMQQNLSSFQEPLLFSLACFAFQSQTNPPLLRVWGNSLAEMAEGVDEAMITPSILYAATHPLKKQAKSLLSDEDYLNNMPAFIALFKKKTIERIHLHYDPMIHNHSIQLEHQSSEGGFILYDKRDALPNNWLRIDHPNKFQNLMRDILYETQLEQLKNSKNATESRFLKMFFDKIDRFINSKLYLIEALEAYNPTALNIHDPVNNWEFLRYTPWRTVCGNIGHSVRQVYMEDFEPKQKKNICPQDAEQLFFELRALYDNLPKSTEKIYGLNPYKKIPVYTPTHAFSLMIGHPTIARSAKSPLPPQKWLEEVVIEPGKKIANSMIDEKQKNLLIAFTDNFLVCHKKRAQFKKEVRALPRNLTVKKFRFAILKLMANERRGSKELIEKEHQFDRELFNTLPEGDKQVLQTSIIHFADTNWQREEHDVHFCIGVHPGTGELAILETTDNGSSIHPVKQYWLINQKWEIYFNTESVLPADS